MAVIEDAVEEATRVLRQAQMLIGTYIEFLVNNGFTEEDRNLLDYLCPRVNVSNVKGGADGAIEVDDDWDEIATTLKEDEIDGEEEDGLDQDYRDLGGSGGGGNKKAGFFLGLLCYLYTGTPRTRTDVCKFVDRLTALGLPDPQPRPRAIKTMFPPTVLLDSTATRLECELKAMFKNGTCDIHKTA